MVSCVGAVGRVSCGAETVELLPPVVTPAVECENAEIWYQFLIDHKVTFTLWCLLFLRIEVIAITPFSNGQDYLWTYRHLTTLILYKTISLCIYFAQQKCFEFLWTAFWFLGLMTSVLYIFMFAFIYCTYLIKIWGFQEIAGLVEIYTKWFSDTTSGLKWWDSLFIGGTWMCLYWVSLRK